MITSIKVNGFKSLNNFDLKLNRGLNTLVGPNGSGKTNIILFFEFLSLLCNEQVVNAVSKIGGAGTIFRKNSFDEFEKEISFTVAGIKKFKKNYLRYEYSACISNSQNFDNIYYSHQGIKVKSIKNFEETNNTVNWDFMLDINSDIKNTIDITNFSISSKSLKTLKFVIREDNQTKSIKDQIDQKLIEKILDKKSVNQSVILPLLFQILEEKALYILNDLRGGESFNIVPSKVKEYEDAANPPGIKKDGSGLSSTLYAIKHEKRKDIFSDLPFFIFSDFNRSTYQRATLSRIIDHLQLANNTIKSLDVNNDPFDNRLVLKITINTGDYESILPLSAMSDGTIKWLTLITAILTSESIFSIEEPENFLHPWMQAEIVRIMRNHLEEKDEESCIIMTTHSESLLNYSEPNELILVEFFDGKTNAKRVPDIELIKNEISNSGLGLGHFYFSNML
ncbi:recombination protein F [compost metagenome]